jgi:hypothetical protein
MRMPDVQIRQKTNGMTIAGGVLALLFLLTAQSAPMAQIGDPMPPPGAVGESAPVKTIPSKNLVRPPRHDKVPCHPHKGACLPKPS